MRETIKKLPTKKTPGEDGVSYDSIKANSRKLIPALTAIFNVCITHRRVPTAWKNGIITLLPKTLTPSLDITEWRPISLLLSSYKIFMSVIQKRIMPWIVETQRLSKRQKGAIPRNGLQEHVFCLKSAIRDFTHLSQSQFVLFIDLADAFGSIDHFFMINSLEKAGYPKYIVDLTRDIYTDSKFVVKTQNGTTAAINRKVGIVQGCPWSVICFEQGIDPWLRLVDGNNQNIQIPAPIQSYVDDISMTVKSEQQLKEIAVKTNNFVNTAGMKVKHKKCAIIHGQRSGNNWVKNSQTGNVKISVQDEIIPVLQKENSYKYLGHEIRIDNKTNQASNLIIELLDILERIDTSLLPTTAKLDAVNVMCISKLNFYFSNLFFSEKQLLTLEDEIVKCVRHWLQLNNSSTRSFFFTPRSKGGLGITNPRVAYHSKQLQFYLSMLNNDDMEVRQAARTSLKLHMSKRKAVPCQDRESSFAGYAISGEKITKISKVNWPASNWVRLFEMCTRENIKLLYNEITDLYMYILTIGDVPYEISHSKPFYARFKEEKLKQFEGTLNEMSSQGRIAREVRECIDSRLSSAFLRNHKLSDEIISFVCRGRLQLLQCNSLLHLYYGVDKKCNLCQFRSDTASHILNGYKSLKKPLSKKDMTE